jgi:hypothetical protein
VVHRKSPNKFDFHRETLIGKSNVFEFSERVRVWARGALHRPKTAAAGPRAAACLVHGLLLQKVTSPRFTTLKRRLQGPLAGPFTSVCSELAIPGDELDQSKHRWLGFR